jgi:NADH:ubiquinone oxidoreductase subunit K
MMVLSYLSTLFGEIWAYISIALGAVYLIAGLCMMAALFGLRKEFALKQL